MTPSQSRTNPTLLLLMAAGANSCGPGEPAPGPVAPAQLHFSDQAQAAGVDLVSWCGAERDRKFAIIESIGQGAAWLDDDGDGNLDLFVVNGSSTEDLPDPAPTNRYFSARGDGSFEDISASAGLDDPGWGHGVAAADADNDGDTELFVTNWGPDLLFENLGAGERGPRFRERAAEAGLSGPVGGQLSWGVGAAWGDVDNDGLLDLYVCNYLWFDPEDPPNGGRTQNWQGVRDAYYGPLGCMPQADKLYRNLGDLSFEDVSLSAGIGEVMPQYTLGVLFTDHDLDGDADIYVANDSMPNYMFENDGSGRFSERAGQLLLAYGEQGNAQAGMGLDAADWDGDGRDDLLVTNFDDDTNTLYINKHPRGFRDATARSGLATMSRNLLCWGCGMPDLDHDGDLDMVIAAGHVYPRTETDDSTTSYLQRNQVLINADGRLSELSPEEGGEALAVREVSRGAAFGDYDADGDVDFLVTNLNRPPTLYRNDGRDLGAWVQIRLEGTRSNRQGVGARVSLRAGGVERSAERRAGASFLSTNSPWMHFGLGAATRIEEASVRWPSGKVTEHGPLEANRRVVLREDGSTL